MGCWGGRGRRSSTCAGLGSGLGERTPRIRFWFRASFGERRGIEYAFEVRCSSGGGNKAGQSEKSESSQTGRTQHEHMSSRSPLKADIVRCSWYVRAGPNNRHRQSALVPRFASRFKIIFHIDEEAAARLVFAGLSASAAHTFAFSLRCLLWVKTRPRPTTKDSPPCPRKRTSRMPDHADRIRWPGHPGGGCPILGSACRNRTGPARSAPCGRSMMRFVAEAAGARGIDIRHLTDRKRASQSVGFSPVAGRIRSNARGQFRARMARLQPYALHAAAGRASSCPGGIIDVERLEVLPATQQPELAGVVPVGLDSVGGEGDLCDALLIAGLVRGGRVPCAAGVGP